MLDRCESNRPDWLEEVICKQCRSNLWLVVSLWGDTNSWWGGEQDLPTEALVGVRCSRFPIGIDYTCPLTARFSARGRQLDGKEVALHCTETQSSREELYFLIWSGVDKTYNNRIKSPADCYKTGLPWEVKMMMKSRSDGSIEVMDRISLSQQCSEVHLLFYYKHVAGLMQEVVNSWR